MGSLVTTRRPMSDRRIVRKPEKRQVTGLSDRTTDRLEKNGKFPQRITLGDGAVGWWLDEILLWLDGRPRGSSTRSTAAATAARLKKRQDAARPAGEEMPLDDAGPELQPPRRAKRCGEASV